MGPPEIAGDRRGDIPRLGLSAPYPSSRSDPCRSGPMVACVHERLVLDDQGNLGGGNRSGSEGPAVDGPAVDQSQLHVVLDQVARSLAGIDIEARDPPGMVVVEHQPGALLVGPVEGLRSRVRDCSSRPASRTSLSLRRFRVRNQVPAAIEPHVGHIGHADALGVGIGVSRRGDPLVGRPVADPRGAAAMEMEGGPVLRETYR